MGLKKFQSFCTTLVAYTIGLPCTINKLCKQRKGRKVKPQPQSQVKPQDTDDHHSHMSFPITVSSPEEIDHQSQMSFPIPVSSPEEIATEKATCRGSDFDFIKMLGRGSYAKVFLVKEKATGRHLAMKAAKKDGILRTGQVEAAHAEKRILLLGSRFHYLATLHSAFSCSSHLFYVMEYLAGGTLAFHLHHSKKFDLNRASFYAAEVSAALQFLHAHGIIHRDVKPNNILLDSEGHCRLTDFGLSCEGQYSSVTTSHSRIGTPSYMAPEVVLERNYSFEADWWSFGILCFKMITGKVPFKRQKRPQLFKEITHGYIRFPLHMDATVIHFLARLLQRNPKKRLGCMEDTRPLREDRFFQDIEWDKLDRKELVPPFKPDVLSDDDTSNFDVRYTSRSVQLTMMDIALDPMDQEEFEGFSFTNPNYC